jgi:hypothetical protein
MCGGSLLEDPIYEDFLKPASKLLGNHLILMKEKYFLYFNFKLKTKGHEKINPNVRAEFADGL